MNEVKIVITGGHHSSALPVIRELGSRAPMLKIYWIGHKYSLKGDKNVTLEFKEISKLGLPFYNLLAGKVYKTHDIKNLLKVPVGFVCAMYYLLKTRPSLILSFGGYLAVPVVIAGWILGIPTITHEQTVVSGYANILISKFAKRILVSWSYSCKYFDDKKCIVTGIPIRDAIFEERSSNIEINNSLPTIYVTAGKTGSIKINELIKQSLLSLLDVCNVIHQCGDYSETNDYERLKNYYKTLGNKQGKYVLRRFVFEDEIGEVFAKSDLVVSRAGAHIVTELMFLRKPGILIPISWVSHNEQYENAKMLEKLGIAELLDENTITPDILTNKIKIVLENIENYRPKENINVKRHAEELIVNEILKFI